jgi:hypothetical protein
LRNLIGLLSLEVQEERRTEAQEERTTDWIHPWATGEKFYEESEMVMWQFKKNRDCQF